MIRFLSLLAVAALSLLPLACSHDKAPDSPLAGPAEVEPPESAVPTVLPSLPDAGTTPLATRKPTGLRDPDLLNDLPSDRQFEPTKTATSATPDGALIASPPPTGRPAPPAAPPN